MAFRIGFQRRQPTWGTPTFCMRRMWHCILHGQHQTNCWEHASQSRVWKCQRNIASRSVQRLWLGLTLSCQIFHAKSQGYLVIEESFVWPPPSEKRCTAYDFTACDFVIMPLGILLLESKMKTIDSLGEPLRFPAIIKRN